MKIQLAIKIFFLSFMLATFLGCEKDQTSDAQKKFESTIASYKEKINKSTSKDQEKLLWYEVSVLLNRQHNLDKFSGVINFTGKTAYIERENNKYYISETQVSRDNYFELIKSISGDKVIFTGKTNGEKSYTKSGFLDKPEWEIRLVEFQNPSAKDRNPFKGIHDAVFEKNVILDHQESVTSAFFNYNDSIKTKNIFSKNYTLSFFKNFSGRKIKNFKVTVSDVSNVQEQSEYDYIDSPEISGAKDAIKALAGDIFNYATTGRYIVVDANQEGIKYKIVCAYYTPATNKVSIKKQDIDGIINYLKMFKKETVMIDGWLAGINPESKTVLILVYNIHGQTNSFKYSSEIPKTINLFY